MNWTLCTPYFYILLITGRFFSRQTKQKYAVQKKANPEKEEFEGTKGIIRIRNSKKNRQYNGQKTEEQTTQWPKEKGQKDKQWSTKHTHKTKDRVTWTPLKTMSTLLYFRWRCPADDVTFNVMLHTFYWSDLTFIIKL